MSRVIRNFDALATTPKRVDALAIAEAGYAAINTRNAIRRTIRIENEELLIADSRYPIMNRRIFFVGVGKCAFSAGEAIEDLLGERLTAGIALDVSSHEGLSLKKIETHIGTHPEPSDVNMQATERIVAFLSECREEDLIIMLISGGGSTLLCLHDAPMTCLDERMLFTELTSRGASIQELNLVRKHISKARGGGLAHAAFPAEVVALVISDVPGDNLEFIASGPTVLDSSTVDDARAVLAQYGVQASAGTAFIETPKEQKYFDRVTNILLITSRDALLAMKEEAAQRGYHTHIVDTPFKGEARDVAHSILETLHSMPENSAVLYAGESTVALGNHTATKGGRNQEMTLSILGDLKDDELILPFASDGRDNSDHAGALADATTRAHAAEQGLSATASLQDHMSYDFFTSTGDFLDTGYTGSNVSDLVIAIK